MKCFPYHPYLKQCLLESQRSNICQINVPMNNVTLHHKHGEAKGSIWQVGKTIQMLGNLSYPRWGRNL